MGTDTKTRGPSMSTIESLTGQNRKKPLYPFYFLCSCYIILCLSVLACCLTGPGFFYTRRSSSLPGSI
uniref:Uncharacterized protein n=1 Tax=Utricularia reniformis TaxID=192314 RepID=A0A1Y0B3C6_9LAMI|nr:hypothetical protein AEK19_MT1783 [Utricularia reniformis]ART31956.1 hypothetical protein AEK19_MT1783 [Utricularia reniformis]